MEEGGQNDEESHPYGVLFFKHPLKNVGIACPAAGQSLVWCPGLLPGSNRRMPVHTTNSLAQATALHRNHGMAGGGGGVIKEGWMVGWVAQVLLGAVSHPLWWPVKAGYRKGTGGPLNSKRHIIRPRKDFFSFVFKNKSFHSLAFSSWQMSRDTSLRPIWLGNRERSVCP